MESGIVVHPIIKSNNKIMKKLIIIIVFFLVSGFQNTLEEVMTIAGKIVNTTDGNGIPGVKITAYNTDLSTTSNQDGSFQIQTLYNEIILSFDKEGFISTSKYFDQSQKQVIIPMASAAFPKNAEGEFYGEGLDFDMKAEKYGQKMRAPMKRTHTMRMTQQVMSSPYQLFDGENFNTETYDYISENTFKIAKSSPLSTFSIDVDGASYSNVRRMIHAGQLPQKDMVRVEEMINYFDYDYPQPKGDVPFSIFTELSTAPWNEKHQLVHIGIQGEKVTENKGSNFVFLVDVSGSMNAQNKLPLLKSSFKLLVDHLSASDQIAIVAYAGAAGLVLPSTPISRKQEIFQALERLQAGGSTAGGQGIQLAYKVAQENFIKGGNNRIILATDGDFNIGVSSKGELIRMIEEKRKSGIYLTIAGFGIGNYKDGRMEQISNAGNGNYYYIDNINEAKKVFINQLQSTLYTIANDVKFQIEFNPNLVQGYRLIGYENRKLKDEDFNNDLVDAGELGAGHTVTALFEIIPVGLKSAFMPNIDELKYQKPAELSDKKDELLTVKIKYKRPSSNQSELINVVVPNEAVSLNKTSDNFRFSASVASYGMLLRDSSFKQNSTIDNAIQLASASVGKDQFGYRSELIEMMRTFALLSQNRMEF